MSTLGLSGTSALPQSDLPWVLRELMHHPAACLLLLGLCMFLPKAWGEGSPAQGDCKTNSNVLFSAKPREAFLRQEKHCSFLIKAALATVPLLLAVTLVSVLLTQDQLYGSCYRPLNGQGQ